MKIESTHSDQSVLVEIGRRIERRRLSADLSQIELAREAGVGRATLQRLESGRPVAVPALIRVARVLGVLDQMEAWLPEQLPSPIETLALRGRVKQRASPRSRGEAPRGDAATWQWESPGGDER